MDDLKREAMAEYLGVLSEATNRSSGQSEDAIYRGRAEDWLRLFRLSAIIDVLWPHDISTKASGLKIGLRSTPTSTTTLSSRWRRSTLDCRTARA